MYGEEGQNMAVKDFYQGFGEVKFLPETVSGEGNNKPDACQSGIVSRSIAACCFYVST